MAWTDQQIAEIVKAFYIDGFSAAQIAPRYGVSRNAIIGVAHRHRQKSGHVPKARPPAKPRRKIMQHRARAWLKLKRLSGCAGLLNT